MELEWYDGLSGPSGHPGVTGLWSLTKERLGMLRLSWAGHIKEQLSSGQARGHFVGPAESPQQGGGSLMGAGLPAVLPIGSGNVREEILDGTEGNCPAPSSGLWKVLTRFLGCRHWMGSGWTQQSPIPPSNLVNVDSSLECTVMYLSLSFLFYKMG